jgi:hypothetical protein
VQRRALAEMKMLEFDAGGVENANPVHPPLTPVSPNP